MAADSPSNCSHRPPQRGRPPMISVAVRPPPLSPTLHARPCPPRRWQPPQPRLRYRWQLPALAGASSCAKARCRSDLTCSASCGTGSAASSCGAKDSCCGTGRCGPLPPRGWSAHCLHLAALLSRRLPRAQSEFDCSRSKPTRGDLVLFSAQRAPLPQIAMGSMTVASLLEVVRAGTPQPPRRVGTDLTSRLPLRRSLFAPVRARGILLPAPSRRSRCISRCSHCQAQTRCPFGSGPPPWERAPQPRLPRCTRARRSRALTAHAGSVQWASSSRSSACSSRPSRCVTRPGNCRREPAGSEAAHGQGGTRTSLPAIPGRPAQRALGRRARTLPMMRAKTSKAPGSPRGIATTAATTTTTM